MEKIIFSRALFSGTRIKEIVIDYTHFTKNKNFLRGEGKKILVSFVTWAKTIRSKKKKISFPKSNKFFPNQLLKKIKRKRKSGKLKRRDRRTKVFTYYLTSSSTCSSPPLGRYTVCCFPEGIIRNCFRMQKWS